MSLVASNQRVHIISILEFCRNGHMKAAGPIERIFNDSVKVRLILLALPNPMLSLFNKMKNNPINHSVVILTVLEQILKRGIIKENRIENGIKKMGKLQNFQG